MSAGSDDRLATQSLTVVSVKTTVGSDSGLGNGGGDGSSGHGNNGDEDGRELHYERVGLVGIDLKVMSVAKEIR